MLFDNSDRDRQNVFGESYRAAQEKMALTKAALEQQVGKGFSSAKQCEEFAKAHQLCFKVYAPVRHDFFSVDCLGHIILDSRWSKTYSDLLWYLSEPDEDGKQRRIVWTPSDFDTLYNARSLGEVRDQGYEPLYYRDYFLPNGYYNEELGKFNAAKPFSVFAENTGEDIWYVYELLRNTAGLECYPYVLRWLREKMIAPMKKLEVIPIFTGAQGTGKSSFGEALCAGLFEQDNVIVTYQFDSQSRFNSDFADALVISIEEKGQEDKKNLESSIKSLSTVSRIRKEKKGIDPTFQINGIDLVISTNDYIPVKFDSLDQRRFMIMETNPALLH